MDADLPTSRDGLRFLQAFMTGELFLRAVLGEMQQCRDAWQGWCDANVPIWYQL